MTEHVRELFSKSIPLHTGVVGSLIVLGKVILIMLLFEIGDDGVMVKV